MYNAAGERPFELPNKEPVRDSHQKKTALLYEKLLAGIPDLELCSNGADYLQAQIAEVQDTPCDLPEFVEDLRHWVSMRAKAATHQFSQYLDRRTAGEPRAYFTNRTHALFFLRAVAPTKLIDGAWLYGLVRHWKNPRFSDLIRTYVEELGDGAPDKNHVLIYRQLLNRYDLNLIEDLNDSLYTQGAIQLALACNADHFLPEVIGFNLGYEQLPLHLMITAFELNELGIDPYYFTLHVTVDNSDTGHAMRAANAVVENLPRIGDSSEFWRRVRSGYQLGDAGIGTCSVINNFNIEDEVIRILSRKSVAGYGAHSDYCRVGGRHVNDWLARPEDVPQFLAALQTAGWIKLGAPVEKSRFWSLLQGERAQMFGVFSGYELQVMHDWIRGPASYDGQTYSEHPTTDTRRRCASFRASERIATARVPRVAGTATPDDLLDSDLQLLRDYLPRLDADAQNVIMLSAMAPSQHWTPAGLLATRIFCERWTAR